MSRAPYDGRVEVSCKTSLILPMMRRNRAKNPSSLLQPQRLALFYHRSIKPRQRHQRLKRIRAAKATPMKRPPRTSKNHSRAPGKSWRRAKTPPPRHSRLSPRRRCARLSRRMATARNRRASADASEIAAPARRVFWGKAATHCRRTPRSQLPRTASSPQRQPQQKHCPRRWKQRP